MPEIFAPFLLENYFLTLKSSQLSPPDDIKVISILPTHFFKTLLKQTYQKKAIFLGRLYSFPLELQHMWEEGKNLNVSVFLRAVYHAVNFYSIEHLLILDGLRLEGLK